MPAVAWAIGLSAAASTAGTIVSAKMQGSAADKASRTSAASTERALQIERENEVRRREEFDRTEAENQRRWNETSALDQWRYNQDAALTREKFQQDVDVYNAEQRRRQPYRDTSVAALHDLASRAGLIVVPSEASQLARPADYQAPSLADILTTPAPRA